MPSTEVLPGVSITSAGTSSSRASPIWSSRILTGAALEMRVVRGAAVAKVSPEAKDVDAQSEAVVFSFPPVPAGGSARLRFTETYTDPGSYRLVGDELVWDRSLGRAANAVVLPAGWVLTNSSAPAIVSELKDGRTRLDYFNPRTDELQVLITARRKRG